MVKKMPNKKARKGELTIKYLLNILLIAAVAIALYFMLRSIGNASLPK